MIDLMAQLTHALRDACALHAEEHPEQAQAWKVLVKDFDQLARHLKLMHTTHKYARKT